MLLVRNKHIQPANLLLHVLNNREISKNAAFVNGIKSRWLIYGLYIVPIWNVEANDISPQLILAL